MPADPSTRPAGLRRALALAALCLAACTVPAPQRAPAPAPAAPATAPAAAPPAPAPAALPQTDPADMAVRELLAYHEKLRRMSPTDVAAEVSRLGAQISASDPPPPPDTVLELALALAQQRNPGDLARASSLLEPIAQDTAGEPRLLQPLARLLAARIAEERRLEDDLERQAAQRRDMQRTIQQLTEKLEALKAIERSMTTRPGAAPGSDAPASPKSP